MPLGKIFIHLDIWFLECIVIEIDRSDFPAPLFSLRSDFPGGTMECWIELTGIDGLWVEMKVMCFLALIKSIVSARVGAFTTVLVGEGWILFGVE
jgi:hypothetical protein